MREQGKVLFQGVQGYRVISNWQVENTSHKIPMVCEAFQSSRPDETLTVDRRCSCPSKTRILVFSEKNPTNRPRSLSPYKRTGLLIAGTRWFTSAWLLVTQHNSAHVCVTEGAGSRSLPAGSDFKVGGTRRASEGGSELRARRAFKENNQQ